MTARLLRSAAHVVPGGTASAPGPAEERFLSTSDLARRWGVSVRTLEGWRLRRLGPPFVRLNRLIVYRLSDILAFEQAGRTDPRASDPGGARDGTR